MCVCVCIDQVCVCALEILIIALPNNPSGFARACEGANGLCAAPKRGCLCIIYTFVCVRVYLIRGVCVRTGRMLKSISAWPIHNRIFAINIKLLNMISAVLMTLILLDYPLVTLPPQQFHTHAESRET